MIARIAPAALVAMVAAACGTSEGSRPIETHTRELRTRMTTGSGQVDNLVVSGPLPDWTFDGFQKLSLQARVETAVGEQQISVMALELASWGGTGKGPADFQREMARERDQLVGKVFGGKPVELEKPLTEVAPGVWSFATRYQDFAGGLGREVYVYHFDPKLPLMHRCKGQARATYTARWAELERICSGLKIELAPAHPMRASYAAPAPR